MLEVHGIVLLCLRRGPLTRVSGARYTRASLVSGVNLEHQAKAGRSNLLSPLSRDDSTRESHYARSHISIPKDLRTR